VRVEKGNLAATPVTSWRPTTCYVLVVELRYFTQLYKAHLPLIGEFMLNL